MAGKEKKKKKTSDAIEELLVVRADLNSLRKKAFLI
jgi:hypothetical protein